VRDLDYLLHVGELHLRVIVDAKHSMPCH
jgi:hypothetical protein